MEQDRAAVLTVRSAVRGIIDYRQADWHNPMWWKRWRYLIGGMENETQTQLIELVYKYQLALMSNSTLSANDFSGVQKEARSLFSSIENETKPWAVRTEADKVEQTRKEFKENWKRLIGFDLEDKEAVTKWENDIAQVLQEKTKTQQEKAAAEQAHTESFAKRVEEIRQRRLKQQGRK